MLPYSIAPSATDLTSPGPIGSVTPSTGNFTALTATTAAIGGATIGSNALAVTGTSAFSAQAIFSTNIVLGTADASGVVLKAGSGGDAQKLVVRSGADGGNYDILARTINASGNFLPDTDGASDLGSSSKQFRRIYMGGAISGAATTTTGSRFIQAAANVTDTSSSGTVATNYVNRWGIPTLLASSATTYTNQFANWFEPATASTNVTITNNWTAGFNGQVYMGAGGTGTTPTYLLINGGSGSGGGGAIEFQTNSSDRAYFGIAKAMAGGSSNDLMAYTTAGNSFKVVTNGNTNAMLTVAPAGTVTVGGGKTISGAATTTTGSLFIIAATGIADTSSSGVVAVNRQNVFDIPTLTATSATTYTNNYANWFEPATASTNVTVTNNWVAGFNGSVFVAAAITATSGQIYGQTCRTNQTTVAGLPSAATAGAGALAFVTDASTTLILGLGLTVAGGGANKVPVFSDGTNWLYG